MRRLIATRLARSVCCAMLGVQTAYEVYQPCQAMIQTSDSPWSVINLPWIEFTYYGRSCNGRHSAIDIRCGYLELGIWSRAWSDNCSWPPCSTSVPLTGVVFDLWKTIICAIQQPDKNDRPLYRLRAHSCFLLWGMSWNHSPFCSQRSGGSSTQDIHVNVAPT